jgi:hypothetical protein
MRIATMLGALGVALMSTSVSAQSVTYDYDRSTDFSRFRTYTWVPGTLLDDEFNHKRIMAAVDAQLAAKGLLKVETAESADVLVAYHASFDRDLQINASSNDFGGWGGWGGYRFGSNRSGTARVQEVLSGTLIVDMVDARSQTIVWRGIASKEIDVKADPAKRDKNMNKAAEKLFKHYPPTR